MSDAEGRAEALVAGMRELARRGLNEGAAGNLSERSGEAMVITPSGVVPAALQPRQMVTVDLASGEPTGRQDLLPSSEWRFHRDIYRARADVGAVAHVHSPYATALACHGKSIPAFHYMVAVAGGKDIRCAPYATFGTQALSDAAVAALAGRRACLLANHGQIAVADSVAAAIALAAEVEQLARQYVISLGMGTPDILDDAEMGIVLEKFKTYGKQDG